MPYNLKCVFLIKKIFRTILLNLPQCVKCIRLIKNPAKSQHGGSQPRIWPCIRSWVVLKYSHWWTQSRTEPKTCILGWLKNIPITGKNTYFCLRANFFDATLSAPNEEGCTSARTRQWGGIIGGISAFAKLFEKVILGGRKFSDHGTIGQTVSIRHFAGDLLLMNCETRLTRVSNEPKTISRGCKTPFSTYPWLETLYREIQRD